MYVSDSQVGQLGNIVPESVIRKYAEDIVDGQAIFPNKSNKDMLLHVVYMYTDAHLIF